MYIFKCVTFKILFKSVQYWRKDQQLLLGYYCLVVLEKSLLSDITNEHFSWTVRHRTRPTD